MNPPRQRGSTRKDTVHIYETQGEKRRTRQCRASIGKGDLPKAKGMGGQGYTTCRMKDIERRKEKRPRGQKKRKGKVRKQERMGEESQEKEGPRKTRTGPESLK